MSGMKKFMHKIKEKMDIHEGQSHGHSSTGGQGQKVVGSPDAKMQYKK